MIICPIDEKSALEKTLEKTIDVIASGGLAIVPTDTVYGIVGDATKEHVILNLFLLKKRSKKKPFPIFVKDIAMARQYAYISDLKTQFLKKIWPGRITVLFYHKEKLPSALTAGTDMVGIRIPDHPFLKSLLSRVAIPLVQTSANISGDAPAKNIDDIKQYFHHSQSAPHLVVDGEKLPGIASAVIDFSRDTPMILRTGLVSRRELDTILKSFKT